MSIIRKGALTEIVYERITQMLYDGLFPPGTPMTRKELAEKLSVSPTPVGEALARLVGEGIVEQTEKSIYQVKEFSHKNLESLYAMRAGLEGIAVRLCTENAADIVIDEICSSFDGLLEKSAADLDIHAYMNADQRFHRKIVRFCDNPYIINYNKSYEFMLRSYQKGLLRRPEETIEEHRSIIVAIKFRDGVAAQQKMTEHHLATCRVIRRMMSEEDGKTGS
ncbi:MAG: GntR family transcriptional regulator [Spirochaetaceae bacterium]|nr:GntR family transcriptional regulator [Spirochaetaceae bacterium]MDT8297368.1 GntR family transcriptional regulator [Spirochaetaceae bacterium]